MPNQLYVGNIPFTATTEDILQLFSSIGPVLTVTIPADRTNGKPRGFAFVDMKYHYDAVAAVNQLHNAELGGRYIMVSLADDRASAYNRPKPVSLGQSTCILCHKPGEVFGFHTEGVCLDCIRSLSLATRSKPSTRT